MSVAPLHLRGIQVDHLLPHLDQSTLATLMSVHRCWGLALIGYCRGHSSILTRKFIPYQVLCNFQVLMAEGQISISQTAPENPITAQNPLTYAEFVSLENSFELHKITLPSFPTILHLNVINAKLSDERVQKMISKLPNLQTIQINENAKLTDLEALTDLPGLQKIECHYPTDRSLSIPRMRQTLAGPIECHQFKLRLACGAILKHCLKKQSADPIQIVNRSQFSLFSACKKLCELTGMPDLADRIWENIAPRSPLLFIIQILKEMKNPQSRGHVLWEEKPTSPLMIACNDLLKENQPTFDLDQQPLPHKILALCKAGIAQYHSQLHPFNCIQYNCLVRVQEALNLPFTCFPEILHGNFVIDCTNKLLNSLTFVFPNLKTLHIKVGPELTTLKYLSNLSFLQHFALVNCPSDWAPLNQFAKGKNLAIGKGAEQVLVTLIDAMNE